MISHKNGMKHLKKERAERDRKIKMENEAGMSAEPERVSNFIFGLVWLPEFRR